MVIVFVCFGILNQYPHLWVKLVLSSCCGLSCFIGITSPAGLFNSIITNYSLKALKLFLDKWTADIRRVRVRGTLFVKLHEPLTKLSKVIGKEEEAIPTPTQAFGEPGLSYPNYVRLTNIIVGS